MTIAERHAVFYCRIVVKPLVIVCGIIGNMENLQIEKLQNWDIGIKKTNLRIYINRTRTQNRRLLRALSVRFKHCALSITLLCSALCAFVLCFLQLRIC